MARNKSGKKANSKYAKGHGKLWKKGQSSSFNPTFNKHRQEAKRRGAFGNPGSSNLTEALVSQHNKLTTENISGENDSMSVGGDTVLTAFTNCSLPSFNRLLKNWNAGSFLHKEMVAVLAAVTEILQKDGEKETETDYFAALMTTLDVVDTDESITAVICLLAMLVKRVNESVLKAQSKKTCETLMKLLLKYMNSDHCALLRNLLIVVHTFLKIRTHWPESCDNLKVILEFTTHQKPKVRKKAQEVVKDLLTCHIPENISVHPSSNQVSKFCIERLESSAGKSKSQDIFYILQLFQEVFFALPPSCIKKCCETIFKIMTLSNSIVTLCGLKSLQGLFNSEHTTVPVDLNARIITALYDYQPNVKDSECLVSWLQLMEKALNNLFSLDEKLCFSHLPKFFSVATKCWLNDAESVMNAVEFALKNLLKSCIKPSSDYFQNLLFEDPINNAVHRIFHCVEETLIYQYHKAWRHILSVLAGFFEVAGKHCYTAMLKCLQALGDLHDSYNFPHIHTLEKTIGTAIQSMGPRIVLQAIPLRIDGLRPDFPRSWMLPLLRDNVQKTELLFFVKHFLPLAAKMRNRALVSKQEGKVVESKLFDVVCSQIWSLLPGFCTEPTDLKQCFREVAQTLGMVLKNDAALRTTVMCSLRLLINKNIANDENREEIANYAKNYLPILFNLYSTEAKDKVDEKVRLAVYDTLKIYLQITNKELVSTFFGKAMEKLVSAESEVFLQQAMTDICKAMIPYISQEQIKELYDYSKPRVKNSSSAVQKKAYSVIKEICCCESKICTSFIKEQLEDLRLLLSESVTGLNPATRALRLNCLQHIVSNMSVEEKSTVIEIIPEAVLCTKENSIKARNAAFCLLVEIGQTLLKFESQSSKSTTDTLKEYLAYLLPGLASRPHFVSATVLAIGRITYEFKGDLDNQIIGNLIDNMCELAKSQSREIVTAVLSFFKILFAAIPTSTLLQHVPTLVSSIVSMSADHQRPFRFKSKEIFTRLIRKFGHEMISKLVSDKYQKQLTNIRKVEARKKRRKATSTFDSDDDNADYKKKSDEFADLLADSDDDLLDDDDDDVRIKSQKRMSKKKTRAPCIEENPEDDIVDFLDPAANKRLLTLQPDKEEIRPILKSSSFPVSEDGRLIIREEYEKSSYKKDKDERSAVLAELGASRKKNKRKLEDSDAESGDETGKISIAQKGIHRSLEPQLKKKRPGEEFKAKKAGGDVKKGKVEPFAYLPLNRQALNKRKRVKLKGQFNSIVKAAKRGASVGTKRKAKQTRQKRH